jgi:hypothetical protein
MDPGYKLTSVKPYVAIIVDYTNKLAKVVVLFLLNTLSGDLVSLCQVFYLFCKELRFVDNNTFILIPEIDWLRVLLEPFLT